MNWSSLSEPLLGGAGVAMALPAIGLVRLRRADIGPVADPAARDWLQGLARRAGVRAQLRLFHASGEPIAAMAVFDGRVFLTEETIACDDRRLVELVVLHELAHLARRDAWRFLFAIAAATILWGACALVIPSGPASWLGPVLFVAALFMSIPRLSLRAECAADAQAAEWFGDARAAFEALVRLLRRNHPGADLRVLVPRFFVLWERLRRAAARAGVSEQELERRLAEAG